VKNAALLKTLKALGCVFLKHGKKHDVYKNPRTGIKERIPRHPEINELLAKAIIKKLS
jgi:predicted RNA binding protein YcfA (HicA-like mRNA interferase family)